MRITQLEVVFDWYPVDATLRASEVLPDFKVLCDGAVVYSGRAVVNNWLDLGSVSACQVRLTAPGVQALPIRPRGETDQFLTVYEAAFQDWEKRERLPAAFKLAVLDLHSYLSNLKLHLDQVELSIKAQPPPTHAGLADEALEALSAPVLQAIGELHDRFEVAAASLSADELPGSEDLVHRMLHPLFLCAPFAHRTYYKPLGYAGDYEMMNMIMRNGFEGESLYAKLVHHWLVRQWAALSVRNRVAHLKVRLKEEAMRTMARQQRFRVLNVGCGPAWEVREFIEECPRKDDIEFTLLDFDGMAVEHATAAIAQAKERAGSRVGVRVLRLSVNQLIRESLQGGASFAGDYEMIYCVGLFDYLSDRICRQLTALFFDWLAPEGLLAVANMKDEKPYRRMIEHLLDWNLVFRGADCLLTFKPPKASLEGCRVVGEPLAVNLFLEIRKPSTI